MLKIIVNLKIKYFKTKYSTYLFVDGMSVVWLGLIDSAKNFSTVKRAPSMKLNWENMFPQPLRHFI